MRLEVTIPDNARADLKAKLASLINRPNSDPEFVNCIDLGDYAEDAEIQKLFTPKRMAKIAAALADVEAGNVISLEDAMAMNEKERRASSSTSSTPSKIGAKS